MKQMEICEYRLRSSHWSVMFYLSEWFNLKIFCILFFTDRYPWAHYTIPPNIGVCVDLKICLQLKPIILDILSRYSQVSWGQTVCWKNIFIWAYFHVYLLLLPQHYKKTMYWYQSFIVSSLFTLVCSFLFRYYSVRMCTVPWQNCITICTQNIETEITFIFYIGKFHVVLCKRYCLNTW